MGYGDIELDSWRDRTPDQMRRALAAAKLRCVSVQEAADDLPGRIAMARDVGASYVVSQGPPIPEHLRHLTTGLAGDVQAFKVMKLDDWKRAAEVLNRTGEAAAEAGLVFCYCTLGLESRTFWANQHSTPWSVLVTETLPHAVKFEVDVVRSTLGSPVLLELPKDGRSDPLASINISMGPGRWGRLVLSGLRTPILRIGDLKGADDWVRQDPDNRELITTEAGRGRMNLTGLLPAVRAGGVRYAFVSQNPKYTKDDVESARISFEYLRAIP
jgi:sugar phosphate isomerase/epimerase